MYCYHHETTGYLAPAAPKLLPPQVHVPSTARYKYVKEFKQSVMSTSPITVHSAMQCFDPLASCSSPQVHVPFTARYEYVKEFKQAHRRDDDIAIVNAGMRFAMEQTAEGAWGCAGGGWLENIQ